MRNRIVIFSVAAVLLAGFLAYSKWSGEEYHVSGFVETDEIRIGSRVGGRVVKVLAEEGSRVERGELLVELDPFDLNERRAEAAAQVAAAESEWQRLDAGFRSEEIAQAKASRDQLAARLTKLKAGPRPQEIEAARARLTAAQIEKKLAEQTFARTTQLYRKNAVKQEEMDRATDTLSNATATLIVRQQEQALLDEGTRAEEILEAEALLEEAEQLWKLRKAGFRKEEIAQAHARLAAAQAALAVIDAQISELKITAPIDGVVEAVELQPGDLVSASAPVLSLMDTNKLWIRAYVPEQKLDIQPGQRVTVAIDSFPDQRFAGEITFISRQAEFTPSNIQTPEERSKQVFRIKVTLLEGLERLRPGMMGDVYFPAAE